MYIQSAIREQFPNVQWSIHLIVPWSQYQMHSIENELADCGWWTAMETKHETQQNLKTVRVI